MERSKNLKSGRFLSLVLCRNPKTAYVQVDTHGWIEVDALLQSGSRAGNQNRSTANA